MNKKGFVLLETIIVLIVALISIISLFTIYNKITTDIERRKYYDNISDLYKVDIIRSLIDVTKLNTNDIYTKITKETCTAYMDSKCEDILGDLGVQGVFVNNKSINDIYNSRDDRLKNSMIVYLKTIKDNSNTKYVIVNFIKNNQNYYASLLLGGNNE